MIRGAVNTRLEAIVTLRVRGPTGIEVDVDTVADSGSSTALTLPPAVVALLALARHSSGGATLADGSNRQFDVHVAEVNWDGAWQPVIVYAVGSEALLGMGLLAGHTLRVDVVPGGAVEITRLP